ncbi:MAG: PAS domain S-box protein, partial [Nocardioidaceae bacterium]
MLTVSWLDALRGTPAPRWAGRALLGVAALLYAVVFALRWMAPDPDSDLLVLLCLPVALLAVSFGRRAGVLAAALGVALTGLYNALGGDVGGVLGYLSRGSAFLVLGFLAGWLSERLHLARQALSLSVEHAQRTGAELEQVSGRLSAILGAISDAVTVGTAVRDGDGRVVDFRLDYVNGAAATLYGRPAHDLVGRRWLELWLGGRDEQRFAAFVRLVETGQPLELHEQPYEVAGADGPVSGLVDYQATRFGDGYVATWRDVTERRRASVALAAASSQFGAAFDHAPVGMVLLDAQRTVLRANAAFGQILGRGIDELTGKDLDTLLDPRDVPGSRADYDRLLAGSQPVYHRERRVLTADGSSRWVSVSVGRVEGSDGVYAVEHFEDIHDRKGFEGQLQHLADHDALTGLFNRRRFLEEL